jgi:hypothetical protein
VVTDHVLCALRTLIKFIFHAQGLLLNDKHLHAMGEALCEFHTFKNAIVNAGGWKGKNGPILHLNIPKLEGQLQVAWNAKCEFDLLFYNSQSQSSFTSNMQFSPI